jgi:histidinol-phosphate/aromatic aminotransferase/cobyric acid decarboxylase-like protein
MVVSCKHGGGAFDYLGHQFERISRADEVVAADVLDAWYPPAPRVIKQLEENLRWGIKTSPPALAKGLIQKIAEVRRIKPNQINVGGGSSHIIYTALSPILRECSKVVVVQPCYGEYAHYLTHVFPRQVISYNTEPNHFRVAVDQLAKFVKKHEAKAVIIVNPCNPTGHGIKRSDLQHLLDQLSSNVRLIIDETYIDYLDSGDSLESYVAKYPNLMIIKSMSKIYALSGLRIGYLICEEASAMELTKYFPPYSVGTLAQMAAITALDEADYYQRMVAETQKRIAYLTQYLNLIPGIAVLPSVGPGLLLDLKDFIVKAPAVEALAKEQAILVRDISDQGPQTPHRYLRIAAADYPDLDRIIDFFGKLSMSIKSA